jgi:hypothetical protein
MNTFIYEIPARDFIKNGGNILKSIVFTHRGDFKAGFNVLSREGENGVILNLQNTSGDACKTHIDLCWVAAKILID